MHFIEILPPSGKKGSAVGVFGAGKIWLDSYLHGINMSQWDFLVDGDAAEDIMWTLCWEFCSVYKKNSAGEMLLTDRFWNSFDIWAQEK